jgi:adenylate cyclase
MNSIAREENHPVIRWLMTEARKHGDVMYGNIGSDTRLDFTVIGPAVDLTARIESMCRDLGRQLLLSSDFVKTGGVAAQSVGTFSLKGVGADQEIFAPIG